MKFLEIFVACICCSVVIRQAYCDELLNKSSTVNWTCICASGPLGAASYSPTSNCSTSCNCTQEKGLGPDGGGWTCLCASAVLPQISGIHSENCFTSCNCSSGTPSISETTKSHVSSKLLVAIILLCVVLTTIAFLVSVACYFYRKDRYFTRSMIYSSDKSNSWNSAVDLLSHHSGKMLNCQAKRESRFSSILGSIYRSSCLFKSKGRSLPGTIIQFSYLELEHASNKFSSDNLIGHGGSSNVYRGQLKDGRMVAIKKLKILGSPNADSEFLSEIELISRLHHCHVVPLLGYCSEVQGKHIERLLVFEFLPNGSLRDCLDAAEPMEWGRRVSIALGAARGLEYLHEAAAPRILHRDIKSTNILLDDKFKPKITDLGMAKRLMADDLTSCASSPARMMGTFGYFAPEYAIIGRASLKSDVFSFGVVILELITGRQPIHRSSNKGDESLVIWATPRLCDSKLVISELPDPLLNGNFPEEEMQIMAHLARECLQWDPDSRPTMSEVVQILSTISPDKSKQRNFSVSLFSSSSSHSIKSSTETDRHEEISECFIERVDIGPTDSSRWQPSFGRNFCDDHQKNSDTIVSAQYMEKLIQLTSHAQNQQALDDEVVDLTEPRFESFVQPNVRPL